MENFIKQTRWNWFLKVFVIELFTLTSHKFFCVFTIPPELLLFLHKSKIFNFLFSLTMTFEL